jgi:PAS domain-containing protein
MEIAFPRKPGDRIHAQQRLKTGNDESTAMVEIEALYRRITSLEDQFSATLGAGARSTAATLLTVIVILSFVLWATGIPMFRRILSALAREHENLRATLDNAPLGIVLVDAPDGRVCMGNAQAWQIPGQPPETGADAGYAKDWLNWRDQPVAKALAREIVRSQNLQWVRQDGLAMWLRVCAAPIWRRGSVVGAVTTFLTSPKSGRSRRR